MRQLPLAHSLLMTLSRAPPEGNDFLQAASVPSAKHLNKYLKKA